MKKIIAAVTLVLFGAGFSLAASEHDGSMAHNLLNNCGNLSFFVYTLKA